MATPAQLTCHRELFGSPSSDANKTPKNLLEQLLCMYACTQMCVCVCTHILVTSCVGACVLACASLCVRVCGSLTSAFEFCLSSPLGTGFYLNFQAL